MKSETKFEIRDLRVKGRFSIDDIFIDIFAKLCGIYATGVYVSLCRHSNKGQFCWPSKKTLATELKISEKQVGRALNILESHKIIIKERLGKKLNNRYTLLDKSEWTTSLITNTEVLARVIGLPVQSDRTTSLIHSKDTHNKDTHMDTAAIAAGGVEKQFCLQDYVQLMLTDKQKSTQIIGLYWQALPPLLETKQQAQAEFRRNLRAAKMLESFEIERVSKRIKWVKNFCESKGLSWTLETVGKYIAKDLSMIN